MAQKFSIGEVVKSSWKILKKDIWLFASLAFAYTIIYCLLFLPSYQKYTSMIMEPENFSIQMYQAVIMYIEVSSILISLITIFFSLGFYRMSLQSVDGKTPTLSAFFSSLKKIVFYCLTTILFNLMVSLGFILFIIPGFLLLSRFGFYPFYIIDKESNPIEALKKSWNQTKTITGKLLAFYLVLVLINFLGILFLGIGLAVTIPLTTIASAYIYRKYINNETEELYT